MGEVLVTARTVGFWARLAIRLIDFGVPLAILLGLVFALTKTTANGRVFAEVYGFYVWSLVGVALLLTTCFVLPLITRGASLGMLLWRVRIEYQGKLWRHLLKREAFFSLAWSAVLLLAMALINHTLVDKFAQTNQSGAVYSDTERLRIGLLSTISTVILFVQFACGISIIVHREKLGLHDRLSNTRTIWRNRFKIETETALPYLPPRPVVNAAVEWDPRD